MVIVIVLVAVAITAAYLEGAFKSGPELPEIMEGEATLTSDDGKKENFHIMIDYKKKLVQLNSLDKIPPSEENKTRDGICITTNKIVVQDYSKVS